MWLRLLAVALTLIPAQSFALAKRRVRGSSALRAKDPARAAKFKAQTLSRATDAKMRARARLAGRPMEPIKPIKVADFSEEDYTRNAALKNIFFGLVGAGFIGLELETLLNGQSKGQLFPELYTPWNYSGSNDAICAEEKAKGIVRTGTGIRSGLCSEYNQKRNEGVRSRVPLKDSPGSVVEQRYK